MFLKNSENVNAASAHRPDILASNEGAPKGITVSSNHNIAKWPYRSNPQPRIIQSGGGRRRRVHDDTFHAGRRCRDGRKGRCFVAVLDGDRHRRDGSQPCLVRNLHAHDQCWVRLVVQPGAPGADGRGARAAPAPAAAGGSSTRSGAAAASARCRSPRKAQRSPPPPPKFSTKGVSRRAWLRVSW